MSDLTLRQLGVFRSVARLGSFTRAAEDLYLGQPAVSQHVAALERALGAALVYRAGRGVRHASSGTSGPGDNSSREGPNTGQRPPRFPGNGP